MMTPKMEAFCKAYLKNGGNGVKAAEEAGYKGSYHVLGHRSYELLKKDEIKEYLAGHAKEACEETQLTVQKVLLDLEWAKETAKLGYPTKEGLRVDLTAFIKATELQGKYLKMWVEKVELTGDGHQALMEIIKKRKEDESKL